MKRIAVFARKFKLFARLLKAVFNETTVLCFEGTSSFLSLIRKV